MDQNQIAKQLLAFKWIAFDSTLSLMILFQDQAEKILTLSLEQAALLPQEGKEMIAAWLKAGQTGREFFKKMMDEGCKTAKSFLA